MAQMQATVLGVWVASHMGYRLNSLEGMICGSSIGAIKGDTRNLDNGAYYFCRVQGTVTHNIPQIKLSGIRV